MTPNDDFPTEILTASTDETAVAVETIETSSVLIGAEGFSAPDAAAIVGNVTAATMAFADVLVRDGITSGVSSVTVNGVAAEVETAPQADVSLAYDDSSLFRQHSLIGESNIGVTSLWGEYSGAGVAVAVIDEGFDYTHPELNSTYRFDLDRDFRDGDTDAFSSAASDKHGTAVMGVIGAKADGVGTIGIAPDADLIGVRIGFGVAGSMPAYGESVSYAVQHADVVNASWGWTGRFSDNFASKHFIGLRDALLEGASEGRDGLGSTIVVAAGNARRSAEDVNYHNFQNSAYVVTVASVDKAGVVASSSNPGAALLVSAPGVGIWTTDRMGDDGYSQADYTTQGGTSFAAPAVSAIVSLMYEANAELGYRDVQDILAYSAKLTDGNSVGWGTNGATNWNGGGMHFSHDYGFGLVDATTAVRLAETWQDQSTFANLVTKSAITVGAASGNFADRGSISLTKAISVADDVVIDKILIGLDIGHSKPSDVVVTIVSPNGTEAVLIHNPVLGTGGREIVFTTSANNFLGENAAGEWTLRVSDTVGNGVGGTVRSWSLQALGDQADNNDLYVYTDEYSSVAGRNVISDAAGIDGINVAAISGDVRLDLTGKSASSLDGKALYVTGQIEHAWAGVGNDVLIGNDGVNRLFGGAGDDLLHGWAGDDILEGDAGDDVLEGGAGNDMLFGGAGTDLYDGGAGIDTIVFDRASDDFSWIKHDGGFIIRDALGHQGDEFALNVENLQFTDITVDLTVKEVLALSFADAGKVKAFKMDAHNNTYRGDGVQVMLTQEDGNAYANGNIKGDLGVKELDVTNLEGSKYSDFLVGNNDDNYISGGAGNDYIIGVGGVDTLYGGVGNDVLIGGHYRGGASASAYDDSKGNILVGGEGNDILMGDGTLTQSGNYAGDDFLWGGEGFDQMYGGDGNDTIVITDTRTDLGHGGNGDDDFFVFYETGGRSSIIGNLTGGNGSDTLYVEDLSAWSGYKALSVSDDLISLRSNGSMMLQHEDGSKMLISGIEYIAEIDPIQHAPQYDFIFGEYM